MSPLFVWSAELETYVGRLFEKYFDYYFMKGDRDLIEEMKEAIKTKTVFTIR